MSRTPTLETDRFVLRELVRADAAALFPAFSDAETMRWWSREPFTDLAALEEYLVPEHGWGGRSWAVTERESGAVVARVAAMSKGDGVAELGYIVCLGRGGQGIVSEALGAVIEQLFVAEGVRRIFADTDPDNAASNRVLEKLGFTLEGRLRGAWNTHIGVRDSLIWGLLAEEWAAGGLRPGSGALL